MSELAGTLRERVMIERRDEARDAIGGAVGEWAAEGTAWARIMPDGVDDAVVAGAREASPRWAVTIRARDGIAPGDRLLWWGRVLTVVAVEYDPRQPDRMRLKTVERR